MSEHGSTVSEHGSNGSNGSIEEIGSEEIEEIDITEDVLPDDGGDADKSNYVSLGDKPEEPEVEEIQFAEPVEEAASQPSSGVEAVPANPAPVAEPASVTEPTTVAEPTTTTEPTIVTEPTTVAEASPVVEPVVNPLPPVDPVSLDNIEEVPRPPQVDPPVSRQQVQAMNRAPVEQDEEDDDDLDETLSERLIGLMEMFPESMRRGAVSLVHGSWSLTKGAYGFSRSAAWIFFSTASILFMPVMIETERLSILDQQKQQKTQMLLGPGVASSGAPSLGPPPI